MNLNFNVKVTAGPRSTTKVIAYCIAVNPKVIAFANGEKVSSGAISRWIETELSEALRKIEESTQ